MVAGGHAWLPGGVCMVAGHVRGCRGAVHGCWGHTWLPGGMHGCQGGMCGCWGGMHGCWGCVVKGGHAWQRGACVGYDEIRKYDQ